MIGSMWATSLPWPTSDSPIKKSAAITTSHPDGVHELHEYRPYECGIESSVAEGTARHAVPLLRVAPTEPYRWGANLPAGPTRVKAPARALLPGAFGGYSGGAPPGATRPASSPRHSRRLSAPSRPA